MRGDPCHADDLAGVRTPVGDDASAERVRTYADAVLGHLDADPRADELLRTLAAFCEHNGHWERTAEAQDSSPASGGFQFGHRGENLKRSSRAAVRKYL